MKDSLIKKGFGWLFQKIADKVWEKACVVLALLFPSAWGVWKEKGLGFFATTHQIPGWAISLGASAVILGLAVLVRQALQNQKSRRRLQPKYFSWGGWLWELTEEFFMNYKAISPFNISSGFLDTIIRGPFCPHCKRHFMGSECWCGNKINTDPEMGKALEGVKSDEDAAALVNQAKQTVYMEAQGAARRGEL